MPAGNLKNTLYQLALPILGLRSPIASVQGGSDDENARLCRLLRSQHAVGACIQRFEKGHHRVRRVHPEGVGFPTGRGVRLDDDRFHRAFSNAAISPDWIAGILRRMVSSSQAHQRSAFK